VGPEIDKKDLRDFLLIGILIVGTHLNHFLHNSINYHKYIQHNHLIIMGVSTSSLVFGFHFCLEAIPSSVLLFHGKIPSFLNLTKKPLPDDPFQRLWRRWHGAGLLVMAYVGYLGITKPELRQEVLAPACGIFHTACSVSMFLAHREGLLSAREMWVENLHLYLAGLFGAINMGLID
jgi:hypothetical protein